MAGEISGFLSLGCVRVGRAKWHRVGKWGSSSTAASRGSWHSRQCLGGCHGPQMPGKGSLVGAGQTPGDARSPLLCWVPGGDGGRAPRASTGAPAHPFGVDEHQMWMNIRCVGLASAIRDHLHFPPFPPSSAGAPGSVFAAAGHGQRGQMLSVSVGGKLSVGITDDGCSAMQCGTHEPCASWHGLGSLWPWGSLRVVSGLGQLCSGCSGRWGPSSQLPVCCVTWAG